MIDAANIEAYRKKKLAAMEAATNQAINKYKDSIPSEASEDIVIIANKDEEIEIQKPTSRKAIVLNGQIADIYSISVSTHN